MLKDVLKKIPYDALVLSRQGNLITVNLGKKDGIEKGKVLTVIQIIKEQRHPKFGILIKTDKEILGKIKLLKIDDNLSFGKIIVEKEKKIGGENQDVEMMMKPVIAKPDDQEYNTLV